MYFLFVYDGSTYLKKKKKINNKSNIIQNKYTQRYLQ